MPPAWPIDGDPVASLIWVGDRRLYGASLHSVLVQFRLENGAEPALRLNESPTGGVTLGVPIGWPDRDRWQALLTAVALRDWPANIPPLLPPAAETDRGPIGVAAVELSPAPAATSSIRAAIPFLPADFARLCRPIPANARDLRANLAAIAEARSHVAADIERATEASQRRVLTGQLGARAAGDAALADLRCQLGDLETLLRDRQAVLPAAEQREAELLAAVRGRASVAQTRRRANAAVLLDAAPLLAAVAAAVRDEGAQDREVSVLRDQMRRGGLDPDVLDEFDLKPHYATSRGAGGFAANLAVTFHMPGIAPRDSGEDPEWLLGRDTTPGFAPHVFPTA